MEQSADYPVSTRGWKAPPEGCCWRRMRPACATSFSKMAASPPSRVPIGARWNDDVTLLRETIRQLRAWFAGELREFDLALAPEGSAFHQRVWRELCKIPYGETISYGELARRVGSPNASRAVGRANGANPIPIVIPCHRVIGSNGKLTGYGGGLPQKRISAGAGTKTAMRCLGRERRGALRMLREHRFAFVRHQQIVHVVGVLLFVGEDAFHHHARGGILVGEVANQLAIMLARDPLGHQVLLDHLD